MTKPIHPKKPTKIIKNIFKYLWDSPFLGQKTVNSPVIDRFAPVYPTSEALLTGRVAGLAGALRGGRN